MGLEWETTKIGLGISTKKTIMRIGFVDENNNDFLLMMGQHQADELAYLGSIVAYDSDAERDFTCGIWKTSAVFHRFKFI